MNAITTLLASKLGKKILLWLGEWEYKRAKERERKRHEEAIKFADRK
jgi:hypothetical protein